MAQTLDLREVSREWRSGRVFEALDDVETGDTVEIVAPYDPEVALYRYRIKRPGVDLEWSYERDGPDEWRLSVTPGTGEEGTLPDFDVRKLVPQRRHEVLLETFDDLEPGEGFVLVNDHDPKPLYHELRSTHGDVFEWEYEGRGSNEWRVAIEKTEPSEAAAGDGGRARAYFHIKNTDRLQRRPVRR